MNKFLGIGFIGKKGIELKFTAGAGKSVASYSVSIPRAMKKGEYDFISCVTWGKQAEWLANNQDRIKRISVEGHIQSRTYEGKNGKQYITELVTDNVEVVEWATSAPNNIGNNDNKGDFREMEDEMTPIDDGDIPF